MIIIIIIILQVVTQLAEAGAGAGGGPVGSKGKGRKGRGASTSHIPYRDSKLTSLLETGLGGNALTLMVACLAPSDAYTDENLSTLAYAAQASRIAVKVHTTYS